MLHASTSPFYPLFATLDVNAKIQGSEAGRRLWHECVKVGIEARKLVLNHCELIRPFIPTTIKGKKNGKIMTQRKSQLISSSSNSTQQIHGINLKVMLMNNTSLIHVNSCLPHRVLA